MRFFRGFRKQYRWILANAFDRFGGVFRENTTEPIEAQLRRIQKLLV